MAKSQDPPIRQGARLEPLVELAQRDDLIPLVARPPGRVDIRAHGDAGARALTLPDVLFGTSPEDWLTERSMPAMPLRRIEVGEAIVASGATGGLPRTIPVLFGDADADGPLL